MPKISTTAVARAIAATLIATAIIVLARTVIFAWTDYQECVRLLVHYCYFQRGGCGGSSVRFKPWHCGSWMWLSQQYYRAPS